MDIGSPSGDGRAPSLSRCLRLADVLGVGLVTGGARGAGVGSAGGGRDASGGRSAGGGRGAGVGDALASAGSEDSEATGIAKSKSNSSISTRLVYRVNWITVFKNVSRVLTQRLASALECAPVLWSQRLGNYV